MTIAQRSSAQRMIAAKGQAMTLTRRAAGAYDPATGTAAITTSTQTVHGAVLPMSAFAKSQGNIVQGDQQLLLSAVNSSGAAIDPKVDDTITDANAKVWSLVAIEPLAPAGVNIMFDCVARRAA